MDILTINDRIGAYPDSYYVATATAPGPFSEAEGDINADVCVVGGGYTGLSAALHLARQGLDVVLLEANRIGSGASGRNGGQVCVGQRVDQQVLEKQYGMLQARQLWDIAVDSVALVRQLAAEATTDCPVYSGIVHADHRRRYTAESQRHVEHLQNTYGYDKISFLDQTAIQEEVGSADYCSGYIDHGGAHLHPLKYAFALAELAQTSGVRLFEQSRVRHYVEDGTVCVHTDKAQVKAKYLVLGLNGYHNNISSDLASRVMPINNFIAVTEPLDESFARRLIKHNYAVQDSRFVVNYFRLSEDNRMIFGGGETYSYHFPKDLKAKVRKPMLEVFPQLQDAKIDYAWGGTLGITLSRLPYFCRLSNLVLSASGFSGHGVAMATMAGKLIADAIEGNTERFDLMRQLPATRFPGGALLRQPALIAGMLWYSMLDKF